jgi:hypothetical protein
MSKLLFQFIKNKYKKTYNILKNGFIKSIFKKYKEKIHFVKAEANSPR